MECSFCEYYKKHECRHQCLNLPDGMTCADCQYVKRCSVFFGAKPENKKCGFEPVRFKPAKSCKTCANECPGVCGKCDFQDGEECRQPVECCRDCLNMSNWEPKEKQIQKITEDAVLYFIKTFIEKNGYPPTTREIGHGVNLKSTSTVNMYMKKLKEKGAISYMESSPRTLTLTGYKVKLIKTEADHIGGIR